MKSYEKLVINGILRQTAFGLEMKGHACSISILGLELRCYKAWPQKRVCVCNDPSGKGIFDM